MTVWSLSFGGLKKGYADRFFGLAMKEMWAVMVRWSVVANSGSKIDRQLSDCASHFFTVDAVVESGCGLQ